MLITSTNGMHNDVKHNNVLYGCIYDIKIIKSLFKY
jgi:hypothetical protein